MRIALIGRTAALLATGKALKARGHQLAIVWTCAEDASHGAAVDDFRHLADDSGAEFRCETSINAPASVAHLERLRCDVAVSISWPMMIRGPVLQVFPLGILNAHAGDLPRYRGNACPNWAILNGESQVGLCIHQMVPELDAGPVVCRDRFPLTLDTYIGDVWSWLNERIPRMFVEAVEGLSAGTLASTPQSTAPSHVLRCYPRRPEDGRIAWNAPVSDVHRLIRASSRPYAGAYSMLEGQRKVVIWRAQPVEHAGGFCAVPGHVCYRIDGDPVVACRDGMLRLTELDVEGISDAAQARKAVHRSLRTRLV